MCDFAIWVDYQPGIFLEPRLLLLLILGPLTDLDPTLISWATEHIQFIKVHIEKLTGISSILFNFLEFLFASVFIKEFLALSMIIHMPDNKPNVAFDFTHADFTILDLSFPSNILSSLSDLIYDGVVALFW